MMQLGGFASAKEAARLPWGRTSRDHFSYYIDVQKRWDTALDARVALDLIGTQSVADGNLPDVKQWVGALTAEEEQFRDAFFRLYERVAALTTTVPATIDAEADFYETVLDTRLLEPAVTPRRVLDIGPGAGRHLANLALRPWGESSAYVGVESAGVPYLLQHTVATALSLGNGGWRFLDQLEHDLARAPLTADDALRPRSAWHVPLWRTDLLPSNAFDVIICNYVLDEVSPPDFKRIAAMIGRCLAPGGIVYCRGGQQRALFGPIYLYNCGSFHGRDITATLLSHGLHARRCDLIASTVTRIFSRDADDAGPTGYAAFGTDAELMERLQTDYVESAVASLAARSARVLIWADHGSQALAPLLERHLHRLAVVGLTNEQTLGKRPGPLGLTQVPLPDVPALGVDAVLIVSFRTQLVKRELRAVLGDALGPVRQFNMPFAHAAVTTGGAA